MHTISDAILWGQSQLSQLESPKNEAISLLCFVLECNKSKILAYPEIHLSEHQKASFISAIQLRKQNIPFAYITGYKEFYDLVLRVTPDTLIPRPDTEILVDYALSIISVKSNLKVLDLGTGSGAIALALKKHRPLCSITASDFSIAALKIAHQNAINYHLEIEFIHSYWFEAIPAQPFNIIVSNPPYIDSNDPHLTQNGLNHEPQTALVSDQQGYADLFYIIQNAPKYLTEGGHIILEHGFEQAISLQKQLSEIGFQKIMTLKDFSKNDRITTAQWLSPAKLI